MNQPVHIGKMRNTCTESETRRDTRFSFLNFTSPSSFILHHALATISSSPSLLAQPPPSGVKGCPETHRRRSPTSSLPWSSFHLVVTFTAFVTSCPSSVLVAVDDHLFSLASISLPPCEQIWGWSLSSSKSGFVAKRKWTKYVFVHTLKVDWSNRSNLQFFHCAAGNTKSSSS